MAIFPIILHFIAQRARSMHDVACEFACTVTMRSGAHAQYEWSRTSLKAETHDATNRCDTSQRQVPSFALML